MQQRANGSKQAAFLFLLSYKISSNPTFSIRQITTKAAMKV